MEPINPSISKSNPIRQDREYLRNSLTNKFKGELGEQFVCDTFEDATIFRNITTTKFGGDIDSIIIENGVLFWVEVKNVNEDFKIYPDWKGSHIDARFDDAHEYIVQCYADEYQIKDIEKVLVIPNYVVADSTINDTDNEMKLHVVETHRQALTEEDSIYWTNALNDFIKKYFADKESGYTDYAFKDSKCRSVKNNTGIALNYGLDYGFRLLLLVLFIRNYYLKHFFDNLTEQETLLFGSTISVELEPLAHFLIHEELNEYILKEGWIWRKQKEEFP